VGDEDDRQPLPCHAAKRLEQPLRLGPGQHRRRLVEDEDARVPVERLEDFHPLPFPHRERGHPRLGLHRQAEFLRQRHEPRAPLRPAASHAQERLGAQHHVVQHRQVARQREMLVHHADARLDRRAGTARRKLLPEDLHAALVGGVMAEEDVHQRRLARPVLAQEREDLAFLQVQRHGVVRGQCAEPLGDPVEMQNGHAGIPAMGKG
jgi:hypothetical protein